MNIQDHHSSSATKKVRKVDIRYAMRTFLIFEYTFGTHLSQKVHISSIMDNYYRYKHENRLGCRLLAIRHIQLGKTSTLITNLMQHRNLINL